MGVGNRPLGRLLNLETSRLNITARRLTREVG